MTGLLLIGFVVATGLAGLFGKALAEKFKEAGHEMYQEIKDNKFKLF